MIATLAALHDNRVLPMLPTVSAPAARFPAASLVSIPDSAIQRCVASAAKWISLQSQPARMPATEYQPAGPGISICGGVPLGAIGLAEGLLASEQGESAAGLSGGLAMAISGLAPAPRPVDGFCLSGSPNALRGLVSPVNLAWSYEAAASLPRPAMQAALGVA